LAHKDAWTMAHIRKVRRIWAVWTLGQLCGIVLLFFYPFGTVAGLVLIGTGFALSGITVCSYCGDPVAASARKCPHCKETFRQPRTRS
jgi:hypothetical protein